MSREVFARLVIAVTAVVLLGLFGAAIWQALHETCSQICVPR